jgi:hypothetical protein
MAKKPGTKKHSPRGRPLVEKIEKLLRTIERLPIEEYQPVCEPVRAAALRNVVLENELAIKRYRKGDTPLPRLVRLNRFELAVGCEQTQHGTLLNVVERGALIWCLKAIQAAKRGKRGAPGKDHWEKFRQAANDFRLIEKIVAATGEKTLVSEFSKKMEIGKKQARNRINVFKKIDGKRVFPGDVFPERPFYVTGIWEK